MKLKDSTGTIWLVTLGTDRCQPAVPVMFRVSLGGNDVTERFINNVASRFV